ncbi:MAG: putative RNase H-related nuclease YkuK (DUF458 family) [Planctomycetota bacterium]|jgi:predicted RNase H-related nuclease YkuK (DUF458 family)
MIQAVRGLVKDCDRTIHVGTDSKQSGPFTDFVTAVVVLEPGRGGRAFYTKLRVPRMNALAQRLIHETQLSIEVAERVDRELPQTVVMHIDANLKREHRSSAYAKMLAGIGMGYGFKVMLKPDAWCATSVADYVVRGKAEKSFEAA